MPVFFKASWAACLGVVLLSASTPACDSDVAISAVPEKVIAALKAAFPNCKLGPAEKRTVDKKLVHYDIEIKLRGKPAMDVYLDGDGKVLRTGVAIKKEEVGEKVPAKVVEAFNKTYGDWVAKELYKETDYATKAEVYSADIEKDGKTLEVDFNPDGTIVKTLELRDDD